MAKNDDPDKPKARRGFAAMSEEQRIRIASRGGSAIKPENRSFSRDPELARRAGRKGGSRKKK